MFSNRKVVAIVFVSVLLTSMLTMGVSISVFGQASSFTARNIYMEDLAFPYDRTVKYDSTSMWYWSINDDGSIDSTTSTTKATVLQDCLTDLTTSGGSIFLNEIAWDNSLTIPENVMVIEQLNGTQKKFINSADSQGSPYTISVTGSTNYHAQDCSGAYINSWESTNITALSDNVVSSMTTGKISFASQSTFTFDSVWTVDKSIIIEGNGQGTVLSFEPNTATTSGLVLNAFDLGLENIKITANENVTNIIHAEGNGARGYIDHVYVEGTNPVTNGQIGINLDGSTPTVYFYKLTNLDIVYCDVGIKLDGQANGEFISNINFAATPTGIDIDTTLNMVTNVFSQTQTVSTITLNGSASYNSLNNIHGESNSAPTILLNSGAGNNRLECVVNTGTGGTTTDNSGAHNYIHTGEIGWFSPPAVALNATNAYGTQVLVNVLIGGTATNVNKDSGAGPVICGSYSNCNVAVILNVGDVIYLSQTTDITWTWWKI